MSFRTMIRFNPPIWENVIILEFRVHDPDISLNICQLIYCQKKVKCQLEISTYVARNVQKNTDTIFSPNTIHTARRNEILLGLTLTNLHKLIFQPPFPLHTGTVLPLYHYKIVKKSSDSNRIDGFKVPIQFSKTDYF